MEIVKLAQWAELTSVRTTTATGATKSTSSSRPAQATSPESADP
ncbi:MAG: hypothetical protein QOG01_3347 [Pseudonocardiales bacterium]|nr:hypothetical protein [Pseudonocardiales bacterium]